MCYVGIGVYAFVHTHMGAHICAYVCASVHSCVCKCVHVWYGLSVLRDKLFVPMIANTVVVMV